jgi:hypothetical protein
MEKIWIILIDGREEGPYSIQDLKAHSRFTPDTLTRKAHTKQWQAARDIAELKRVFKDDERETVEIECEPVKAPPSDEIVMDWEEPPQTYLWLIVAALLLLYILYRFFNGL